MEICRHSKVITSKPRFFLTQHFLVARVWRFFKKLPPYEGKPGKCIFYNTGIFELPPYEGKTAIWRQLFVYNTEIGFYL
jgi:hypothetical protein